MLLYYVKLLLAIPSALLSAFLTVKGAISTIAFFLLLTHREWGERLGGWKGISRKWAIIPILALTGYLLLAENYRYVEELTTRNDQLREQFGSARDPKLYIYSRHPDGTLVTHIENRGSTAIVVTGFAYCATHDWTMTVPELPDVTITARAADWAASIPKTDEAGQALLRLFAGGGASSVQFSCAADNTTALAYVAVGGSDHVVRPGDIREFRVDGYPFGEFVATGTAFSRNASGKHLCPLAALVDHEAVVTVKLCTIPDL